MPSGKAGKAAKPRRSERGARSRGGSDRPPRGNPRPHAKARASLPPRPFVGRARELERLEAALEEAIAGRGRIVLLSGEPGVGKSRLTEELCARARSRGMDVAWGSSFEGEGAPPYWPWSEVVRDLIETRGEAAIRRCMARGLPVIAAMLPAAADLAPDHPPPVARDRDPLAARFRFFDASSAFLTKASAGRPLVVVLDDLHWADEGTLLLLSFVSRDVAGSPMLVIGTCRDQEVRGNRLLAETLGELVRSRAYEQVSLPALGLEDVRSYLEAVGMGAADGATAERILAQTEGNAFLVTEVVSLLVEEGAHGTAAPAPIGGLSRLPDTVREVMRKRLARLSEGCQHLLTVAAGLGREFELPMLERCLEGIDRDEFLRLVDEAARSGLVAAVTGRGGCWRFTHVLTQQSVLAELAPSVRSRLHARIATALEGVYGSSVDAHARELVEHLEQAREVMGTEKLGRYLGLAGEQALASYAYEEATGYLERALEIRDAGAGDVRTADLLSALARAQVALYDRTAVGNFAKAGALYEKAGLGDRIVDMLGSQSYSAFDDPHGELFPMFERTLDRVARDSPEETSILAKRFFTYADRLDLDEQRARFMRALRGAADRGAVDELISIRVCLAEIGTMTMDLASATRHAERAWELTRNNGDPFAQRAALMVLINRNMLVRAPVAERERAAEELRRICETLRDRRWLRIAYKACEEVARDRLEWRRAIELNDLWQSTIPPDMATMFPLLHRGILELQLGMSAEADRTFATAVEWVRHNPREAYEKAAVSQYLGRAMLMASSTTWLDAADRFAREALADQALPPLEKITAHSARGAVAVVRGDTATAASSYEAILPALKRLGPQRSDFAIGLLARTAGDREAALRHFRDAAESSTDPEDRQYTVWPRFFLADTLISGSRPGDREEAEDILKELVEIAARTESVLLGRRASELLEQLRSLPSVEPKVKRPGGLTDREVEILRAVASGKTNKEIGYRLCISRSTVNTHLGNILTKIGAANRAEAVSFAARSGLLENPQPATRRGPAPGST